MKDLYVEEYWDMLPKILSICKGAKGTVAANLKRLGLDTYYNQVVINFETVKVKTNYIHKDVKQGIIAEANSNAEKIVAADRKRKKLTK